VSFRRSVSSTPMLRRFTVASWPRKNTLGSNAYV
jgi:hypothetical protein